MRPARTTRIYPRVKEPTRVRRELAFCGIVADRDDDRVLAIVMPAVFQDRCAAAEFRAFVRWPIVLILYGVAG
jgi:hypothetical protein